MGHNTLSMTKFLADLTEGRTYSSRPGRLSLPRGKSFLGLRNPRFVYGGKQLLLHLDHNRVMASINVSDAPFTLLGPENDS